MRFFSLIIGVIKNPIVLCDKSPYQEVAKDIGDKLANLSVKLIHDFIDNYKNNSKIFREDFYATMSSSRSAAPETPFRSCCSFERNLILRNGGYFHNINHSETYRNGYTKIV